jgi:hypothetical protein
VSHQYSTGDEDDVLIMPQWNYRATTTLNLSILNVEEAPAKDALISVSVKITGCNEKRSEHKTFMLRDNDIKKINNIDYQILEALTNLKVNLSMKTWISMLAITKGQRVSGFALKVISLNSSAAGRIIRSKSPTLWCDDWS